MPPPSLSARTLIWDLSRKNVQHLPDSPMPPVFWAGGRSPFSCECSGGKSHCRIVGHHPSSAPTPLHYTRHSTQWQGNPSKSFLKGVSSITFIMCSMEWVQPNSAGSNGNTSWYLARSWQAASTSSGAEESNPLRSNSLNKLPCLCLTVSWGVWGV